MAITREQKEKQLEKLIEDLGKSKLTLAVDYRGLNVEQMQQLRKALQAEDGNLKVIKKTLIKLGIKQNPKLEAFEPDMADGPVALAFGFTDELSPAKVVHNFAKANPNLEVLAAITADGELLNTEQVKNLALLPSSEQLQAMLVGVIAAPARGLVTVLSGNMRGLVQVLSAKAAN